MLPVVVCIAEGPEGPLGNLRIAVLETLAGMRGVWAPQSVVICLTEAQHHVSSSRRLVFKSHSSTVSGKTRQSSLPIPFRPIAEGPPVNCATRCFMSLAEAVEVRNATVNEVGAKYEIGCESLSNDLSNVVEVRSCRRGKETRGG